MTAKQLEQDTGCKIMVRGKGSMRDKKKEDQNRGKPNWEHLNEELHVLITVEDTHNRYVPIIKISNRLIICTMSFYVLECALKYVKEAVTIYPSSSVRPFCRPQNTNQVLMNTSRSMTNRDHEK